MGRQYGSSLWLWEQLSRVSRPVDGRGLQQPEHNNDNRSCPTDSGGAAEADQNTEHDRWLRDRKFAAYANFIGQVQELNVLIVDLHTDPDSDVSRLPELAKKSFNDELLLLVPAHIKRTISPVWHGVSRMTALYQEMPAGEERIAAFDKATDQFNADFQKLSKLLRDDLGVED